MGLGSSVIGWTTSVLLEDWWTSRKWAFLRWKLKYGNYNNKFIENCGWKIAPCLLFPLKWNGPQFLCNTILENIFHYQNEPSQLNTEHIGRLRKLFIPIFYVLKSKSPQDLLVSFWYAVFQSLYMKMVPFCSSPLSTQHAILISGLILLHVSFVNLTWAFLPAC